MNLNNRLKALEAQAAPQTLPDGEGKRRLESFLDRIAERQGPPTEEQSQCATEFLKNEWPALIKKMRQNNRGKHVD